MIKNCGTFHGTIAADHPDGCPVQVHFAEHTLAAFHPGEVAGGGQREVYHAAAAAPWPIRLKLRGDPISSVIRSAISSTWPA